MTVSPFDSAVFGPLLGDPEVAALFSDEASVAAMILVERALARVEGACGVIPAEAGKAIDTGLSDVSVDPAKFAAGTAQSGVPVPALVQALRDQLEPAAGQWLHWGATSQDIVDTALVLQLDRAMTILAARMDSLIASLSHSARRWADLPMAGRTRSQIAAPTTFGLRVARWAQPLIGLRHDLDRLHPHVARIQFGGAVGTNAAIAPHGPAVTAALARELGLAVSPSWHGDRSALGALAGWCAGSCAALGRMAGDLVLMGRSEAGEARAGTGGGSSTMPQKSNPVAAETILALARYASCLVPAVQQAGIHVEERDGAAWSLEWLALPQIVVATAAALRHANGLASTLVPDERRMRAALELDGGAALAELASFALAAHMPRAEAQDLVKRAAAEAAESGSTLAEAISRLSPVPVEIDVTPALRAASALVDEVLLASATETGDTPPR
jgi:3-carboxy-cis,cis-muconate cycloisomerase